MVSVTYFLSTRVRPLLLLGFLFGALVHAETSPTGKLVKLEGLKTVSVRVGGKSVGKFGITYNSATKVVKFKKPISLLIAIKKVVKVYEGPVLSLLKKGVVVAARPPRNFEESRRRKISAVYRAKNAALSLFFSPDYFWMRDVGYSVPISSIFQRDPDEGVPSIYVLIKDLNEALERDASKFAKEEDKPRKVARRKAVGKRAPVARKPVVRKPVARAPVAAKPVARAPVTRKPVVRKPVARAPVVRRPVARAPVVRKPVARAPVVRKPVARAPVVRKPVARAPVARKPVVRKPVARAPVVRKPVARAPVARKPVVRKPVARAPVVRKPVARAPVVRKPVARAPVARKPVARAPVARKPVARAPVARKPVAKAPVARKPVVRKPVARAPVARKPVAKAPVARKPVAKAPLPAVRSPLPTIGLTATLLEEVDRRLQRTLSKKVRKKKPSARSTMPNLGFPRVDYSKGKFPHAKSLPSG